MKYSFFITMAGLFLVGSLSIPAQANKAAAVKSGAIQKNLDDLRNEITQMKAYEAKTDAARDELATRILGPDGRQMTQNVIDLDLPIAENYRNEAWNDIGWLQGHWKALTTEQRHSVDEAETDVE